jgi:hypothetical protein
MRRAIAIGLMWFLTAAVVAEAHAPTAAPPTTTPSTSPPPSTLHAPTRTGAGASSQPTTHTTMLGRYKTETEAKQACAGDTVVWANTSSKVLHPSGDKYYGHTKRGAYVCQTEAQSAGYHLAK